MRPVVADADTLFPATTRGLLIYLDFAGLIRLHWSQMILGELARTLVETGRKKTLEDAKAHEARMQDALPHALVATRDVQAQFASVAHAVRSAKDVHVAACAHYLIAANAYGGGQAVALVTRNTKDFRKGELAKLGIALRKPDEFLPTRSSGVQRCIPSLSHRFELSPAAGRSTGAFAQGRAGTGRCSPDVFPSGRYCRTVVVAEAALTQRSGT